MNRRGQHVQRQRPQQHVGQRREVDPRARRQRHGAEHVRLLVLPLRRAAGRSAAPGSPRPAAAWTRRRRRSGWCPRPAAAARSPRTSHSRRRASGPAPATAAPAAAAPSSRLADGPKFIAFSAGTFIPANGPPRPGPPAGRGIRMRRPSPPRCPAPRRRPAPPAGAGVGALSVRLMPPPPPRAGSSQSPGTSPTSPAAPRACRARRSGRRRAPGSGPRPRCWRPAGR